eukprot:CAMPEP_0184871540 /NCGR_PEP_ID=MMETSP0580-20130426/40778_1 /TAXON_ID=1118495 /ORGANISM="Dactyliosolen fragilissimus" /LENGTH=194 /DNA_ID=CAMNT_0027374211 /DNA_START=71 /DNA_END=655 /DNA_ORIENTATION=-
MVKLSLFCAAFLASSVAAFAPVSIPSRPAVGKLNAASAPEVDNIGNNVAVKNLLSKVESTRLLSKVAEAGLLSKAQESGISLTKLEPLLKLAAENKDVMILLEAAAPEALPILPKVVDLAPAALPLLAQAIKISPGTLQGAAAASIAAAGAAVYLIPDDSVLQVAGQTVLGATLGLVVPAASLVGSTVLSKIKA